MVVNTQGSTRGADIDSAQKLFGPGKLFLLTKIASSREIRSLLEELNADEKIAEYTMLTGQDIVPATMLAEARAAVRILKHDATFWSGICDQEDIAIGAPGSHLGKVAIWASPKDAVRIWNEYV